MQSTNDRGLNVVLWVVQALLCGLYLFTGITKLAMVPAALRGGVGAPPLFFPFVGLCEFLGAVGLILPSVLRIATRLTPIAAAGLAIIMIGAIHSLIAGHMTSLLWLPIVALVGDLFVLIGRFWLVRIDGR